MFVVIVVIGALLLVSSFLFDDLIDELVPGAGFLTGPVLGAFLAAFGLFGWFVDGGLDRSILPALAAGTAAGVVFAAATYRFTRALANQPTDATPTTSSLVGSAGRVVTPIRAGGVGEVLVTMGGASTKLTATAAADIPTGQAVVVIAAESPTKVRVEPAEQFWS
jgi:membrane-bound ClpP family serine protease